MAKKIVHLTAHMGGGVGKVLSGICTYAQNNNNKYLHEIIMLEHPEKRHFVDICEESGVNVTVVSGSNVEMIKSKMEQADIVQIEWWHHPKLAELITNFPHINVRLVVWSHISGCNYPYLPVDFLAMPDKFVFTSNYSFYNPFWNEVEKSFARNQCVMINSSGGFEHLKIIKKKEHNGFNIGYIGTQNFSKIHPQFVDYCKYIKGIPNIKFILVGDRTNQETILKQANNGGIADQFVFRDYVKDVSSELSWFDVFGYILNPQHFGTTENALLEAMAAGLPVVCLNQCAEQFLIKHNETGLLVRNEEEYAEAISYLYNHPDQRVKLGEKAREFVLNNFMVEKTVLQLHTIYDKILLTGKRTFNFQRVFGRTASEWFLSCLPPSERQIFKACIPECDNDDAKEKLIRFVKMSRCILDDKSKSSLHHFSKTYPQDLLLRYWSSLLEN
ncbi:glycosyltransferase family 4 protein [Desulfosporosinus sp. PR]|uniref:glycosyltransferase family 4 protein n=1 Tax=Candidatus Desulfosporosinus nitrosoreducens TaxID=3401928 RepID=UPI0027F5E259|nr:glycosyltransferase family 4 protein [Desulfosporosinus sp. PR]MDQ7096250.1 glycosyltransferase family 4 protein [Desulfosporosinus sp. PR]